MNVIRILALLLALVSCAQETDSTKAIKKDNINKAKAEIYYEAFVETLPETYWRLCSLSVRPNFDFDTILGASNLDYIENGLAEGTRSVSIKSGNIIALHVNQSLQKGGGCVMTGWSTKADYAERMRADAVAGLECEDLKRANVPQDLNGQNALSYSCGETLIHAVVTSIDEAKYAISIFVVRSS